MVLWGWEWLRRAFAASARGDWVMRFIVVGVVLIGDVVSLGSIFWLGKSGWRHVHPDFEAIYRDSFYVFLKSRVAYHFNARRLPGYVK